MKKNKNCMHLHPDHSIVLPRLKKVSGQISGIERMIEDRRYCADILVQIKAVLGALRNIEVQVFETHLKSCVQDAMNSKDKKNIEEKINELTKLLLKRNVI